VYVHVAVFPATLSLDFAIEARLAPKASVAAKARARHALQQTVPTKDRTMTVEAASNTIAPRGTTAPVKTIHPLWVRVTHWINAVAIFMMVGSGWEIYNASPLFGFTYPKSITIGGWLAGALLWHFAAMWLLAVNGLIYVTLGILTGRFRRKLFPLRPREVIADAIAALRGKLAHDDLSAYNAVQKLLYLGVILAGVVIVLSGMAIWKPVQMQELTALFGGYDAARYVHFFAMATIVGFLVVHIVMAFLVPRSLRAIILGR
jgi:thiosulfate reductase cytochrome b subunit